jgi:hypothetical protein
MYNLDTESLGFFGPTLLIQYAKDTHPQDVYIHNIFERPVHETLTLIEEIVKHGVCGFNMVHDWFHISKTYGILSCLPSNIAPNPLDYRDIENDDICHDQFCLKPSMALDLLLVGKRGKFQSVMNRRDITIRKVPRVCAEQLVKELLDNIHVPDIYFSKSSLGYRWQIIELEKGKGDELSPNGIKNGAVPDPTFVNIRLRFNPSGSLKSIMKSLGHEVTELRDLNKMDGLPRVLSDTGWWPCNGKWVDDIRLHLAAWRNNPRRIEYAKNDVRWLHILRKELGNPSGNDTDSILACSVGAMYWKGFSIDRATTLSRYRMCKSRVSACEINVSSPIQVRTWLQSVASPMEKILLKDTRSQTLRKISEDWAKDSPVLSERCRQVIDARQAKNEALLLSRLLIAGRAYFLNKIVGTKSNRMSGGGESYIKSNGSINPQGIRKGDATRGCFTLAATPLVLCGGDFDAFEVSIAEAVYNDPDLRKDLLSKKKIHALLAADMYNKTYEEVMATASINKEDANGLYSRGKTGVFLLMYGGEADKLSREMRLTVEEARAGLNRFFTKYPGIRKSQSKTRDMLTCLVQPDVGGKVVYRESQQFVESMLGFRRGFELEYSIVKAIYDMASNPSEELSELGRSGGLVVRRDRSQSTLGATISSLYAIAFSICAGIIRAGINHEIQSPGGDITKELQAKIWTIQPCGIGPWLVMPLNIHDELECPTHPNAILQVTHIVQEYISFRQQLIPLLGMKWNTHMKSWSEK